MTQHMVWNNSNTTYTHLHNCSDWERLLFFEKKYFPFFFLPKLFWQRGLYSTFSIPGILLDRKYIIVIKAKRVYFANIKKCQQNVTIFTSNVLVHCSRLLVLPLAVKGTPGVGIQYWLHCLGSKNLAF